LECGDTNRSDVALIFDEPMQHCRLAAHFNADAGLTGRDQCGGYALPQYFRQTPDSAVMRPEHADEQHGDDAADAEDEQRPAQQSFEHAHEVRARLTCASLSEERRFCMWRSSSRRRAKSASACKRQPSANPISAAAMNRIASDKNRPAIFLAS